MVLDTVSSRQVLLLVTGAAGSGKTSTMHSLLGYLNQPERKICTVEEGVSLRQSGIRQVEVNGEGGLSYPMAMKAALAINPDILMVGELRDADTARAAINAALSGRLVIAGLSAETAIDGLQRLLDLGISHLDVADSLLGIASQALVRTLCISCKAAYQPEKKELVFLASQHFQETAGRNAPTKVVREGVGRLIRDWEERLRVRENFTLYKATGCKDCLDTGYRGQIGVHQLLMMSPEIKRLVINKVSREQIREKAMKLSMRSLKQDGIEKILKGYTDFSQARVL